MSRCVNQVQDKLLSLVFFLLTIIHMLHLDGMTLDGDTTFLLQVHVIKHLTLGDLDGLGFLQESVSQG